MKPSHFFPWRLFRWFVTRQLILVLPLFILFNGILYWVLGEFRGLTVAVVMGAMLGVSILICYRLLLPLGRLIEKTKRMRESPFGAEEEEPVEQLAFDEPGEWYELERALNRLGRDLRQKTIRLSREKTELRTIMSAVSEAVLAIGEDRRVLFYNPQFAYLFGMSANLTDVLVSEVLRAPDILQAYEEVMNTGQTLRREVQEVVAKERLPRDFLLAVAPLVKKHNQEIYGVVGIFHDITEMKQAERIRIEFVGNVSHELRTPLTTVNGYMQTLMGDLEKGRVDQAREFGGIISQNVSRMMSLVEDLLDLSALESGKELKVETVDVRELTEAVLRQVNTSAHKIDLRFDVEALAADPKRLEQVLRNLLENAIRYVPDGKSIEVSWRKERGGRIGLHVKDDGPGIAPRHQSRLFERFYRVDEARSRATGGTGIGLSLVKHIVQRHGGQVYVRSVLGQGSEFVCEFPER
jgi:two-component system phosphate regulon sensor histidine kinase PhoR